MFHSPAPLTLPNRSTGLCPRVAIRRDGLLRHVIFLAYGDIGKTLKFYFFTVGYYELLVRILKPLVPNFCLDLAARLKNNLDIQENISLSPSAY